MLFTNQIQYFQINFGVSGAVGENKIYYNVPMLYEGGDLEAKSFNLCTNAP